MKRLLLAPLLIALTGCSSDIVVKTDIGEEFIIKKSTVKVIEEFSRKDLITHVETQIKSKNQSRIDTLSQAIESHKEMNLDDSVAYVENNLTKVKAEIKREISNKVSAITKESLDGVHLKVVMFRPIFQNLNNQKQGMDYTTSFCFNPEIDSLSKGFWTSIYPESNINNYSVLALDTVKQTVCKKYAKF